jgi:ribonuclease HI
MGITKRNQSQEKPEQQEIQEGLQLIGWKELRRIPSTGAYVAQTLYRLKSNKFPLWNRSAGNLSCPHPSCTSVAVSTSQHVFWECPGAKGWWSQLLKIWRRIGFDPGEAPLVWIFGLELPDIPSSTWPLLLQRMGDGMESEEIQAHIFSAAAVIWRFLAATAMHGIWSERLRRMEADGTQEGIHKVIVQTTFNRALQRLLIDGTCGRPGSHDDAALAVLRAYVTILLDETTVPVFRPCGETQQDDTQFLLFFDGGSRGNPGPGGAGAVIVRLRRHHHAASAVWAASMAYGNKATTNNIAEYRGLLLGLRYAYNHALGPLHVVGDSAMVISQQRLHKSPAKAALASLYRATKSLADVLGIQSWSHHYRDYNKMADCAANVAMDSKKSQQVATPTTRPLIGQIELHMDSDVGHWVAQTQDQFQQQDPNTRRPRSSPKEHAIAMRGFRRRLGIVTPSATHSPSPSGLAK